MEDGKGNGSTTAESRNQSLELTLRLLEKMYLCSQSNGRLTTVEGSHHQHHQHHKTLDWSMCRTWLEEQTLGRYCTAKATAVGELTLLVRNGTYWSFGVSYSPCLGHAKALSATVADPYVESSCNHGRGGIEGTWGGKAGGPQGLAARLGDRGDWARIYQGG
jgi:hypothetical protein